MLTNSSQSFNFGLDGNGLHYNPIGAFYESRTLERDNAASIANKTLVLLDSQRHGLTAAQLAALDSNHDGQLSGSELAGLSAWADLNENGVLDAGELQSPGQAGLSQIRDRDYAFYTQGNSRVAMPAPIAPGPVNEYLGQPGSVNEYLGQPGRVERYQGVPASNFRALRDSDHAFITSGGLIEWRPDMVKINSNNRNYLIGTDGNDNFDADYYAKYSYFNSSLLTHFLAGGGDDTVGGSVRNDFIWGGTGNDLLFGYAGNDQLYGEEGNDELQGQDGWDYLDGGVGNDRLSGGAGNDVLYGGDGNDVMTGEADDDSLYGGRGADLMLGGDGHDYLDGGDDNDQLSGGNGNDLLFGGDGADELQGDAGNDYLLGESGNDRLLGGTGNDVLNGGDGDDQLSGEAQDDSLYGGRGADVMLGGDGNDYLAGGDDNDQLSGNAGHDVLFGGNGDDELQGGADNDRLLGEAGNDRLFGQVGNDTLWGGAGDDMLMGFTASNDSKQSLGYGETDNDVLYGGAGNDSLYGGLGDDLLDGGDDNDVLVGNDGNDTLLGGAGDDQLQGNAGNDVLQGGTGNDKLFGQVGDDVLYGGDGNDILVGFTATNETQQSLGWGQTDNDTLYGGAGNDLILSGLGNDTLWGETGDDELQGGDGNDLLYGGEGNDRLFGQLGDDVLYGGDGDDILVGFNATNDRQTLNPGETDNDWLYGGAGNDILLGGAGNDYLDGGAGADQMEGGTGNDVYIVNSVNDSILERSGEGYDVVVSSANYLLNANIEELRLVEGFNIHATGNALDNRLIGNSSNNILDGVTGKDTMLGGAGDDTYYVDNLGDQVIEFAGEGVDTVQSSISYTLADNVENLILLDFGKAEKGLVDGQAILVYGYPKANELDYMQGDAVADFEGTCALTAIANLLTQADRPTSEKEVIQVAIDNKWAVTDPTRPAYERGGSNFVQQQALLDSFGIRNDLLAGYNEQGVANLVRSGRGVILAVNSGQLWNDPAYVGNGAVNHVVTITGAVYNEASGALMGFYIADSGRQKVSDMTRYVSLEEFRRAASVASGYAIYTLEPLKLWNEDIDARGNSLDNTLIGNRGNNVLSGGAGNDTLSGGAGNDRLEGGAGNDTYLFNLGDGHDTLVESDATSSHDVLKFGAGILAADIQIGRKGNDLVLTHLNGQDQVTLRDWFAAAYGQSDYYRLRRVEFADGTLWDREQLTAWVPEPVGSPHEPAIVSGPVLLVGGADNDTFEVTHSEDLISEAVNAGIDQVNSTVSYTLGANVENLTLTGTEAINGTGNAGHNVLIGNAASNILTGGAGNDTLDGGLGADRLVGGSGDDTYGVDDVGDVVVEAAGEGLDQVNSAISYTLGANVENLTLTGTEAIDGTGNAGNNVILGNAARNVINGGAGQDSLDGGAGNDLYLVGAASDHATTGEIHDASGSEDELRFSSAIPWDTLILRATDTGLERVSIGTGTGAVAITTGTTSLNVDASAVGNGLTLTGNAGNNRLTGTAFNDVLDGGAGFDTMIGGAGDDTYIVNSSGDTVTELVNQGIDTVVSSNITYTLKANVENLTLTGTAMMGTGNELNNVLIGNARNNQLKGMAGNDTLDGQQGNDTLTGGTGNDTYLFGRGYGRDTVIDNDGTAGNADQALFLDGINFDQLWFRRGSNNLEVNVIGTSDTLVIQDWYVDPTKHVEALKTSNGQTLIDSQVQNLVNAMAAFAPPPAGQLTLPDNYRAALDSVLAANWQA